MIMRLSSTAFDQGGSIPSMFTCDGEGISPALVWSSVPGKTKSLALIVEDPDAPDPASPQRIWVHWVLYNVPPSAAGLPQDVRSQNFPCGTLEGINDWERTGYDGPCPPLGEHRYVHKLYALDTMLPDLRYPTKAQLESAMQGHIIAQAELIGIYQRQ